MAECEKYSYLQSAESKGQGTGDKWKYFFIFILSVGILSPLIFYSSWPITHDGLRYLALLDQFKEAFMHGILYPRWLPEDYGGYGYPTFVFYQPGIFYLALLFSFLVFDLLLAMHLSLLFLFFVGGVGIYKLIKEISSDTATAMFCSILFLLTPYLYVNLYVRGALSELASMFICPWPLYFLILLKKRISRAEITGIVVGILAFSLFVLIITHPFTAMFYFPVFCIYTLYLSSGLKKSEVFKFWTRVSMGILLAVILSSPFWFTAFQMKQYVHCERAFTGHYAVENHFVFFPQFFSRFWGFGGSEPGMENDGMSFQLGLPHFLIATLGLLIGRKNKFIQLSYALYIILIIMMTPICSFLWKNIGLLRYVQFPWRLLSVTALVQILCASGLNKFLQRKSKLSRHTFCSIIIITTLIWNNNQFQIVKIPKAVRVLIEAHRRYRLETMDVYASMHEFIPKTVRYASPKPRGQGPLIEVSHLKCRVEEFNDSSAFHLRYMISNELPQLIVINQLYLPGWKVMLDKKRIDDSHLKKNLAKDGRMQLVIPQGEHYLEAYYGGPPGWRMRNIIIILSLLGYLIFCMKERRRIFGKKECEKKENYSENA